MHVLSLLFLAAFVVQSTAPARPDFSGQWIATSPKQIEGQKLTITQDDRAVMIEVTTRTMKHTARYDFDGTLHATSDSRGKLRVGAQWQRNKLVLIDVVPLTHQSIRRAMSLTREGHLVLELRDVPGGDNDPGMHSDSILDARRAVFKKQK